MWGKLVDLIFFTLGGLMLFASGQLSEHHGMLVWSPVAIAGWLVLAIYVDLKVTRGKNGNPR